MLADLKTLFYNMFGSVATFSPVLVLVMPLTFITMFTGVATFTHIERYCGMVVGWLSRGLGDVNVLAPC